MSNKKGHVSTAENPGDSKLMLWIRDVALKYDGDECLIWPFGRDPSGYGSTTRQGRKLYAHRYICELVNGPPPNPRDHAAHSCDNGPGACVTRRHLSWKSNAENQVDRWRCEGVRRRFKLTPEQAEEIRALKGVESPAVTAQRYGVGEAHVRQVQSGRTRSAKTRQIRQFADSEIHAIRQSGAKPRAIANEYGVNPMIIYRIRNGVTYRHVPLQSLNIHQRGEK